MSPITKPPQQQQRVSSLCLPDLVRVALADRLGGEEERVLENGKVMAGCIGWAWWASTLLAGAVPFEPLGTVMAAGGMGSRAMC